MRRPWKNDEPSPIEEILRENRPEPRDEFSAELLERLESFRPRRRRLSGPAPGRALAAVALTVVALVGATVAAGGPSQASHSLVGFVNVGDHTKNHPGDPGQWGGWPGNWQYSIPICHKRRHDGWILLNLPPFNAILDLIVFRPDFIVTPNRPCPPAG